MLAQSSSARPARDISGRLFVSPLALAVGTAAVAFTLAPWPLEQKAHALLHGLCTQRPSHSLTFGAHILPFDARMTGIYAGFLVSFLYLIARGRLRARSAPSIPTVALGALFIGAMALDGGNSFIADIGAGPMYTPANWLRLTTGILTGTALAPIVMYLLATTLWRPDHRHVPVVNGIPELIAMAALQSPLAVLLVTGGDWLFDPTTMLLIVSALLLVSAIVLVVVVLVWHGDGVYTDLRQVQLPAIVAFALAIVVVATLGGGRFVLERLTGAPPLT